MLHVAVLFTFLDGVGFQQEADRPTPLGAVGLSKLVSWGCIVTIRSGEATREENGPRRRSQCRVSCPPGH